MRQKRKNHTLKFLVCSCLLQVAALGGSNSYAETANGMDIHYGRVTGGAPVEVKNHTAEGALVGGVVGAAIIKSGSKTADVVGGAAIGASTEYLGESRMKGMRYTVESAEEGTLHIITDQTGVRPGDCVAIEATTKYANIRRVSDVYCETAADGVSDDHLDDQAKQSAADCHQAKKELLGAAAGSELEQAKRRVRALCDT